MFYGQENAVKEAPSEVARPLRKYTYRTWGGKDKAVEAHFVRFEAQHVSFWVDRPESNTQDTLVVAELCSNVTELKEVVEAAKAVTVSLAHMEGTVPFAYIAPEEKA